MTTEMNTDYYDGEAKTYDASRGGQQRASAAAGAIAELAPETGRCLDLAGGTGIVSAELADRGWSVFVADLSAGMLREAASRLPGRVLLASAERLPIKEHELDLVSIIWMLNLVPTTLADTILTEACRVIRPGGQLVLTVNKEQAHDRDNPTDSDDEDRVGALVAALGFSHSGGATFSGRSPWGSVTDADPTFRLAAFRRTA